MSGTVTCQACGRRFAEGDRFCPGCGTAVLDPVDTAAGQQSDDPGTNPTQCVKCAAPMGRDDQFCPKCGAQRPEPATVVSHVSLRNAQAAHLIEATHDEYEIIQQLGQGAMGAVYLARDIALSRKVAIKVIAPNLLADDTMISRFRLEAQTVASLRHPNIVNVHAVREADDLHYFVMEFIDGPPLRSVIKSHAPLDVSVVQGVLFQVGSALSYAHRTGRGVIHRDIKPANIMVNHEGDAFVTDFGISKIAESQSRLTQTGATIGTPEYMSPEQCRGETLTGASDQYALGIMAYEMLCGATPFSGAHYAIMMAHTSEQPKPIREIRPDCPADVAEAVERMLAKAVEERWPDLDMAVTAMGGAPLGYKDPTRTKIVALIGSTQSQLSSLDTSSPLSPVPDSVSVEDSATSVTVTGLPSVVEAGDTFELAADVRGSGDVPITGLGVRWVSTDPSVARVEGGHVEALQTGSVSISASVGNVANSVLLSVAEPAAAQVRVSPSSVRIQRGGRIHLSAQVQDRRGRELERDIRWLSSDASVATVTQEGEVVAAGSGSVTIAAESEGVTGTAEIVVEAPVVEEVPVEASVVEEAPVAEPAPPAREAPARPKPAPRRPRPVPVPARPWYRNPGAIAASIAAVLGLSAFGLWSAVGPGDSAPARAIPDRVEMNRQFDTLAVGETVTLEASAFAGAQELADLAVGWVSDDPHIAVVDSLGSVAALSEGTVRVSATIDGVTAEATLVVQSPPTQIVELPVEDSGEGPEEAPAEAPAEDPVATQEETVPDDPPTTQVQVEAIPPVEDPVEDVATDPPPPIVTPPTPARLVIDPLTASMQEGQGQAASARVLDAGGARLAPGAYTLSWRSSNPTVISVSRTGAVSAGGPGTAWLVASAANARDSVLVTVAAAIVAVEVGDSEVSVEVGESRVLTARVLGSDQQPIDRDVTWSTANSDVVAVDAGSGRITAVAAGTVEITASVDAFEARVMVSVADPAPDPTPPSLSPEAAQQRIASYVALLNQGDREAVTTYCGTVDEDSRDELFDLMDERSFRAALGEVGDPVAGGDAVAVSFEVDVSYRTSFGQNRDRTLSFRGGFERVGSEWQLTSCVLQPGGP